MKNSEKLLTLSGLSCKVVRSRRKTLAIDVKDEGIIVRAPLYVPEDEIRRIIIKHKAWIEKSLNRLEIEKKAAENPLSPKEIEALKQMAQKIIPERVKYFAEKLGITYGRITIRTQRTRWGSCSSKGNLNFNCLLMLTPPEVIDSVVVHELCHRREMNHSKRFYDEVLRAMPDYPVWNKWLRENGGLLLKRIRSNYDKIRQVDSR